LSGRTGIIRGACVAVIAGRGVGNELATCIGVTGIVGARVPVVAAESTATGAFPLVAGILHGAEVIVVARQRVEGVDAPPHRVTGVSGAEILVSAVHGAGVATHVALADIAGSTRIAVVAVRSIRGVLAARGRIAGVVCARIAVITIDLRSRTAVPIDALVKTGTDVAIGARALPGNMLTTAVGKALVSGTGVCVIAIGRSLADASSIGTVVPGGALVVVRAVTSFRGISASILGVTAVLGAGIGIVTGHHIPRHTTPACASVAGGADATVVTWCLIVAMGTAGHRLAEVVGTWVLVIAGHEAGSHA
jgi:hypothetical protein